MATIPDALSLGASIPTPQPSLGAAGYEPPNFRQVGMVGAAVAQGGRDMEEAANIVAATNERQDRLVVQNAANQQANVAVQAQFDPKTGWANAKEGQAVGQRFIDDNMSKFTATSAMIRDGLENENQKKIFDQHASLAQLQYQGALFKHQAQETDKFNTTTENSTLDNTLASMARDPSNELNFQTGMVAINGTIDQRVARLGLPEAAAADLKRHYLTAAYATRIDSIARGVPGGAAADPVKAQDTLKQVWDQLGAAGPKIWDSVQAAVNTAKAKDQGSAAFNETVGTLAAPAVPRDLGLAVGDRPFTPQRIDQIKAFVQKPSPWEADILAAAQATGVNPAEIKLKIAIESGGNPTAVNPQGGHGDHATGLGQFMAATAKQYGVEDRNDPVQSIWGIARFLKSHGGTQGANMTAADQAYIGSGDASKQYVENTRAARVAAIGGGGGQTNVSSAQLEGIEGQVIKNAEAKASADAPNDPALRDKYVTEARRNWSVALQSVRDKEYADFTGVLDSAVKGGAQAESDLPADAQRTFDTLPIQRQISIRTQFDHNARAARGEFAKSDPRVVNDLMQRIYLPEGDPKKITQPGQLFDYMGKGLNYTDQQHLTKEIKDANTPEGSPFLKQVATVKDTGRKMLVGSLAAMNPAAMAHPDVADEAAYRFGLDLEDKIKAARTAGKDPQTLFTPTSPDYVLAPARVAAFMPTEAQIVADAARGPKAGSLAAAGVRAPVAAPALSFASEAEATTAAAAGKLKPGDRIKIGNQTGTWH